jgi:2-isopropylmalate synthase
MAERVRIFDTTLRDGEQSPGATMNTHEKLQMARQLETLGVDVIEAGFPIASESELDAVRQVASVIKEATVAALARCKREDIDCAYEAVRAAVSPRIHVFISTSDIHLEHMLRISREQVLEQTSESVQQARSLVEDVEFSAMDATRSDREFMARVVEEAIKAGAKVINIPDTVGYSLPSEMRQLITYLRENVDGIDDIVLSTHCHNDLGLAVANSLAAVEAGVRQVECTVNGIGERAGNAALEEIVMALRTRGDLMPFETGICTQEIYKASKLLSSLSGLLVQYNKAIVGRNAFAHESGIHQHGVIRKSTTYEIMKPEDVGRASSELVLGRHSGRHGLRKRCEELGFRISDEALGDLYQRFIALTDKKKEVYDEDLLVLLEEEIESAPEVYHLDYLQTTAGNATVPTATVRLTKGEESWLDSSVGDGPVDAAYRAVERITNVGGRLLDYSLRSVTKGKDALGEVFVTVQFEETVIVAHASSTDVIEASVKAYLNALNKFLNRRDRTEKK